MAALARARRCHTAARACLHTPRPRLLLRGARPAAVALATACGVVASSGVPSCAADFGAGVATLADAKRLIDQVYGGIDPSHGPALSPEEEDVVDESGGSHIYGEITVTGVHTLIEWLLNRSAAAPDGSPHRLPEGGWAFTDLGSGVGRMCVHVAAMAGWGVTRSVGIELSHTRHLAAIAAAERARSLDLVRCPLEIIEGDILVEDLTGLTVVYVASLLFEDEMLAQLAARLDSVPSVQWVATLRPFDKEHLNELKLTATMMLPMSWDEDAEVYIYVRDASGTLPDYGSAGGMSLEEAETRAFFAEDSDKQKPDR